MMLSIRKPFVQLNSLIRDYSSSKTVRCMNLRLWRNKNIVLFRTYFNLADRLKIDETGNVKLQLDPKVEALQDKLIYCDYIEGKRLKLGYKKNKAIENALKQTFDDERLCKLINEPVNSIALKYLKNDVESIETKKEVQPMKIEKTSKPIYMPYSATNKFQLVKNDENNSVKPNEPMPELNECYKKLYDSYLAAKEASARFPQREIKDLETRIDEMEKRRPADSLSNVPVDWMTDYEQFNDDEDEIPWKSYYGTSKPDIPVSSIPCGGCGALLHCQDAAIPGYLAAELFAGLDDEDLKNTICQRCHFMKNYNTTLEVTVSPEVYPAILSKIALKDKRAAVLLMIDLTDFPCSIWPNLPTVIGKRTPIFVVGNKVDLLPRDSPRFFENVEKSLLSELQKSGLGSINIKHIALISAKTGYGIERLINKLHLIWGYKGDVYMIGCTNVGKSTLFNTLLQSDYCKVQAVDLIQRATTSPWPGTTLNLLKFPILNPVRWRLFERVKRQQAEQKAQNLEQKMREEELRIKRDIRLATLQERIGRTFPRITSELNAVQKAYDESIAKGKFGINENDDIYKKSRWCYDTPGVMHPDQVLDLLTTEELLSVLPKQIISPRTFIFKPGQTMFLAGLGRVDMLKGPDFIRITVFACGKLPITICLTEHADEIYDKLLHTDAFIVPSNDPERLKIWPTLQNKEFSFTGISKNNSVADVLLSSIGWVAFTPDVDKEVSVKVWTPEGRGIYLRTPALLSKSIVHRGRRIKSSLAYQRGRQVYVK